MTLVTLFTSPKPFADPRVATIQMNAIASWCQLSDADVILLGEEEGLAEAGAQLGARVIPDVRKNALGTPLISSMIDLARRHGRGELLCLVNADMIIMADLMEAALVLRRRLDRFVMLGRRWDVDIDTKLDFAAGWEHRLRATVAQRGRLHRPAGSDFFVFPRGCYAAVPDFAVGRAGWDNWMIFEARQEGWPVVDCSRAVMVVHQNHDYSHLPGGMPHYSAPESNENIRLAGGHGSIRYTVLDATHVLENGELARPPLSSDRFLRGMELVMRAIFAFLPAEMIEALARPRRWKKRLQKLLGKQNLAGNGDLTGPADDDRNH